MRWLTVRSDVPDTGGACRDVVEQLARGLAGERPTVIVVFAAPVHVLGDDLVRRSLNEAFPASAIVGCSATGVIGGGREIEDGPALVVMAGVLPGVEAGTFHLSAALVAGDEPVDAEALAARTLVDPDADPVLMVLADPFSCRVEGLLEALDQRFRRSPILGALASGGRTAGTCRVMTESASWSEGAVGLCLVGDVALDVIVAQGCRAVGPVLTVTDAQGPVVTRIQGQPALVALREVIDGLEEEDGHLFRRGPMVGWADGGTPGPDTWLVRPLLGVDPRKEAFAIGHRVEQGDALQLHVRDPAASVTELGDLVARWRSAHPEGAAGVLLMDCLGRGARFYGQPDVDSRTLREVLGDVPIAGFFGNGEIGPVRHRTWLHGQTAVVGLLRTRDWN